MAEKNEEERSKPQIDADAFEREVTTDLDEETPDKPEGFALHTRILIGLAVGVIAGVSVNYAFGGDQPRFRVRPKWIRYSDFNAPGR